MIRLIFENSGTRLSFLNLLGAEQNHAVFRRNYRQNFRLQLYEISCVPFEMANNSTKPLLHSIFGGLLYACILHNKCIIMTAVMKIHWHCYCQPKRSSAWKIIIINVACASVVSALTHTQNCTLSMRSMPFVGESI